MLVKYKGGQTAIRLMLGGLAVRLAKGENALLTTDQVKELKTSAYTKQLIKDDQLSIDDLSGHDKAELEQVALTHKVELPAKATVKDIRALLSGTAEDEDQNNDLDLGETPDLNASGNAGDKDLKK